MTHIYSPHISTQLREVFQVNPYDVKNSIGILIDLVKAAKIMLCSGSWGSPIWLSMPEKEEDVNVVKTLLIEAGFSPKIVPETFAFGGWHTY
jgi:hypothetical protein